MIEKRKLLSQYKIIFKNTLKDAYYLEVVLDILVEKRKKFYK